MSKNLPALKRGWHFDTVTRTLDAYVDGVSITKMAPGNPDLNVYTTSTTQLYPLGTRLEIDERVFRYCRAGSALVRHIAGANADQWSAANAAAAATSAVGATTVTVANTVATADLYVNGWAVIFTSPMQMRRITSNTATDATNCVLTLDGALDAAVTSASTWITAYPSIYYDVRAPSTISSYVDYISFVCVPLVTVASGSYFWGQTWGPCYGVAGATVPGSAANQREIYFSTAGNLWDYGDAGAGTGAQYAGYLLPRTASGSGDQFYMLQLAP